MNPSFRLPSNHHITRGKDTLFPTIPHTPDTHTLRPQSLQQPLRRYVSFRISQLILTLVLI